MNKVLATAGSALQTINFAEDHLSKPAAEICEEFGLTDEELEILQSGGELA